MDDVKSVLPNLFALPTLDEEQMSKRAQIEILLNQATAMIVTAHLEHCTAIFNGWLKAGYEEYAGHFVIDKDDITDLIAKVQLGLRKLWD